jgi:eukaryotic-like serine/threonine-protein kinase
MSRDHHEPSPSGKDPLPLPARRQADTVVSTVTGPLEPGVADEGEEQRFHLRFEAEEVIAVGGMGQLRRHRDRFLRRDVVAKGVRPDLRDSAPARLRLLREARIQAGLQHPCIVPVYDVGNVARSDVFFLMAHIGGITLQDVLAGLRAGAGPIARRFSRRRLLESFCRVCLAMAYAHERGVVHRDLKPENIMLGEYGEIYVLDWGVAKQREEAEGGVRSAREAALAALPHLHRPRGEDGDQSGDADDDDGGEEIQTEAGTALGTLEYMAPEQYLATRRLDERSDIYALGAILYEILSLSWFREAPTRAELGRLVRRETTSPLERSPIEGVSAELDSIWRRATATRPADRFQTARDLHDAIIGHLDEEREKLRARDLAMEHARAAALEIADDSAPAEEAEARRGRALRRLGQALAVDPTLAEALKALVQDLLVHPAGASAEVEEEMRRTERETTARSYGLSAGIYAIWLGLLVGGGAVLGVLDRAMMLLMGGVVSALLVYNVWLWRRRPSGQRHMLALTLLGFTAVGMTSTFLGPLVLLPSLATTMFAAFAVTARSDARVRAVTMAASIASVAVPVVLQLTGVVPSSYLFEDGKIVILPRLVALPSQAAHALLGAVAGLTIVLSNLHFARVVHALVSSERSALTQAHRLRQLLPAASPSSPTRSVDNPSLPTQLARSRSSIADSSAVEPTASFSSTRARCSFTVASLMPRSMAICLLSIPRASSSQTSRSRGVSWASFASAAPFSAREARARALRSTARSTAANSSSCFTGLSRKSTAPLLSAEIVLFTSAEPVRMITGNVPPRSTMACCTARPEIPGIRRSSTAQPSRCQGSLARNLVASSYASTR